MSKTNNRELGWSEGIFPICIPPKDNKDNHPPHLWDAQDGARLWAVSTASLVRMLRDPGIYRAAGPEVLASHINLLQAALPSVKDDIDQASLDLVRGRSDTSVRVGHLTGTTHHEIAWKYAREVVDACVQAIDHTKWVMFLAGKPQPIETAQVQTAYPAIRAALETLDLEQAGLATNVQGEFFRAVAAFTPHAQTTTKTPPEPPAASQQFKQEPGGVTYNNGPVARLTGNAETLLAELMKARNNRCRADDLAMILCPDERDQPEDTRQAVLDAAANLRGALRTAMRKAKANLRGLHRLAPLMSTGKGRHLTYHLDHEAKNTIDGQ